MVDEGAATTASVSASGMVRPQCVSPPPDGADRRSGVRLAVRTSARAERASGLRGPRKPCPFAPCPFALSPLAPVSSLALASPWPSPGLLARRVPMRTPVGRSTPTRQPRDRQVSSVARCRSVSNPLLLPFAVPLRWSAGQATYEYGSTPAPSDGCAQINTIVVLCGGCQRATHVLASPGLGGGAEVVGLHYVGVSLRPCVLFANRL